MHKVSVPNQSCRAPRKITAAGTAIGSVEVSSVSPTPQQLRRRIRHADGTVPPPIVPSPSQLAGVLARPEHVLDDIAEQALILSGADGAAIALNVGNRFECCARAGLVAPAVGTPLDTTSGLSGECFRSGKAVSTDDTDCDPRVDSRICRMAGIRSVMVVPLCNSDRVTGMLTVFSSRVAAFGLREKDQLQSLASFAMEMAIAAAARKEPTLPQEPAADCSGPILPLQKRPGSRPEDSALNAADNGFKQHASSAGRRVSAGSREIDRCLEAIRQDSALRLLGHVKTYLRIENLYDGEDRTAAIEICDRLIMERGAEIGAGLKGTDPHAR